MRMSYWSSDVCSSDLVEMPPIGTAAGVFRGHGEVRQTGRWEEDIPPSAYDPDARLKEIDRDTIWGEVMYPTFGLGFYGIDDAEFKIGRVSCRERVCQYV